MNVCVILRICFNKVRDFILFIYLLSVAFRGSWIFNLCYLSKSPYVTVIICKYIFAITLTDRHFVCFAVSWNLILFCMHFSFITKGAAMFQIRLLIVCCQLSRVWNRPLVLVEFICTCSRAA